VDATPITELVSLVVTRRPSWTSSRCPSLEVVTLEADESFLIVHRQKYDRDNGDIRNEGALTHPIDP